MRGCFCIEKAAEVKQNLPLTESQWELTTIKDFRWTRNLLEEGKKRDSLGNEQPANVTGLDFSTSLPNLSSAFCYYRQQLIY